VEAAVSGGFFIFGPATARVARNLNFNFTVDAAKFARLLDKSRVDRTGNSSGRGRYR
jgi:hypothetical protein